MVRNISAQVIRASRRQEARCELCKSSGADVSAPLHVGADKEGSVHRNWSELEKGSLRPFLTGKADQKSQALAFQGSFTCD